MTDPFREAEGPKSVFWVCPGCQSAVETATGAERATCASCDRTFATKDAQSLAEHDAAARLAKALAPIPEDTPRGKRWRRIGLVAGVGAPVAMLAGGLLFGGVGLALGGGAIGVLLAVMGAATRTDPYGR